MSDASGDLDELSRIVHRLPLNYPVRSIEEVVQTIGRDRVIVYRGMTYRVSDLYAHFTEDYFPLQSPEDLTSKVARLQEALRSVRPVASFGPIDPPAVATGFSDSFSFDEAFADALHNLPPPVVIFPDRRHIVTVLATGAELGGSANARRLFVRVLRQAD
jgi:hypothetical protein